MVTFRTVGACALVWHILSCSACCPTAAAPSTPAGSSVQSRIGGWSSNLVPLWKATHGPVLAEVDSLRGAGRRDLQAGKNGDAEEKYRTILAMEPEFAPAYERLAEALVAQGRNGDAMSVYHSLMFHSANWSATTEYSVRSDMNYAVLLAQAGEWQEAVAMYNRGAASVPGGDTPQAIIAFDPKTPEPIMLEASAHVAIGMDASTTGGVGHTEDVRAMKEYAAALALEPNWIVARFYDAYGKERLGDRTDAAKLFDALEKSSRNPLLKSECAEVQRLPG